MSLFFFFQPENVIDGNIFLSLEELHLSFNQMEISVDESSENDKEIFPKIKILHFDGNCVENRDHLLWLSNRFPSLTSLVLCDCPLWTLRWNSSAGRKAQVAYFFKIHGRYFFSNAFYFVRVIVCLKVFQPGHVVAVAEVHQLRQLLVLETGNLVHVALMYWKRIVWTKDNHRKLKQDYFYTCGVSV